MMRSKLEELLETWTARAQKPPKKSKSRALRLVLLADYHAIKDLREARCPWTTIATTMGKHKEVVRKGWGRLEAAIAAGKITPPPPPTKPASQTAPVDSADGKVADLAIRQGK